MTPSLDYFFQSHNNKSISFKVIDIDQLPNKEEYHHTPYYSFTSIRISFDKDPMIRNEFRFMSTNDVRIGKILEILDIFSAKTIFRHMNKDKSEVTLVTASVSAITLFEQIDISKQLIINSYVTMVGNSSLENRVDFYSGKTQSENDYIGSATFTFVARDPNDYSKAYQVPKLKIDVDEEMLHRIYNINKKEIGKIAYNDYNDIKSKSSSVTEDLNKDDKDDNDDSLEIYHSCEFQTLSNLISKELHNIKLRFDLGIYNKQNLIQESLNSLYKTYPNHEEIKELHNIFLNSKNNWSYEESNTISISKTLTEKVAIMFSQHINYNGHIFGGFVMREAVELSYACLKLFNSKSEFSCIGVDSVTFYKPVVVSSIAHFKSYVTYRKNNLIHTTVEVYNIVNDDKEKYHNLTTTLNIIFSIKTDVKKFKELVPETYDCGIRYLDGKRRLNKLFESV